ncbi:hypothetical protein [uncultured Brevundimonas sp.]|uniref:hypothetical protein n=1 Tax=uncultured Brevundimonas sp. TaxID=213418 RepID=UPI002639A594|nr:hypothetical protein [uncultured Brevundimonas sp.]
MAEFAAAAWAVAKASAAYVAGSFKAVAAGSATAAQIATYVGVTVGGSMALTAVAGALMKPNVGGRAPGEWVADPNAGIPFAIGPRIGAGGNIVYKNTFGKDNEYKGVVTILSGAGPIGGFLGFTADREPVTFAGEAATGRWAGEMWMQRRLGQQPETALSSPAAISGHTLPGWGPAYALSGKAAFLWTLRMDSKFSTFSQGEPPPVTVMQGIRGYDHRLDSTMPGGLGPVRWGDRSTWPVITNPIIADLNWCLGLRENGKVVGGLGVRPEGVDWAAYTQAANVADANAWTVAAYPRSDEPKSEVRAAFLQAGGAVISRRAGLVSCVTRGVAKAPVMTISAADTAGPIELDTAANVLSRLNTLTPRYLSEAHEWQIVPADPVSAPEYVAEDRGRVRSDARDYPYAPSAKQAAELAALDLANSREGIAGRWPLKPHCRDIQPGEVFAVVEPELLLDGMEMLCLQREYDPGSDTVWVTFVSETPGKVAWALGQTPHPPPTPALAARPDLLAPDPDAWEVVIRPPTEAGGLPIFDIVIEIDNARAQDLIVEVGPSADGPWTLVQSVTVQDGVITISGLDPDALYWVALSYRSESDGVSPRSIKGPYRAGQLIASDLAPEHPIWAELQDTAKRSLQQAIDAANALLREDFQRGREVVDVLDRLGIAFEIDPVERTGLIREETVAQGVGPGGTNQTLVAMNTRLIAADEDNSEATAQALIAAKVYTDDLRSDAAIAYATYTAMGDAISLSASGIQSWATGEIAAAVADLVTGAQFEDALSVSKGQWESYATDAAANAIIGLDTVAAREDAVAASALSLQGWVAGNYATSSALLATQTTLGTTTATASLALSTAQGGEAYAALTTDINGRLTAMRINGVSGAIDFLADYFNVTSGSGGGINYSAATKTFKIHGDGQKTVLKAAGGIRFWSGPSSVADGSETAENGVIALGPGVPGGGQFNGLGLAGPFSTGVSGAVVLGTDWQTVGTTAQFHIRNGIGMVEASWDATLTAVDPFTLPAVNWRLVLDTNEVIASGQAVGIEGVQVQAVPPQRVSFGVTGPRQLILQLARDGASTTAATINNARARGLYAPDATWA